MRLRVPLLAVFACLVLAPPGAAERGPLDAVVEGAADPPTLHARLAAFADSVATADPALASQALAWAGVAFARAGEPDSAVARHERAFALDPREPRRTELATALLARLATGDAPRAREVLRPIQPITPELPDPTQASTQGLFAWSHYLAGRADSAARLFAPVERWLSVHHEWRYRMACVALERQDWVTVQLLLAPLAVVSRLYDRDVMEMLERSAAALDAGRRLQPMLLNEMVRRDKVEQELLAGLGARRIGFRGRDGFPLGGTLLAPARARGARVAVVIVAPGDTLALYDSLAVGLRRMGLAVILLDPRGSGRSVAPGCPLPESWRGREARMQAAVAGDVAAAAGALAREVRADSSQYLVVGVGTTGPIAVLAARADRRARAVMLVSPVAPPVERGALRAAVAEAGRPIYFQTGPEDFTTWDLIDALYEAADPRASRVADSDRPGTRTTLFHRDPAILNRFRQWLSEAWPRPAAPRATPPPRPRRG
jgi:alpha-beta hydrolase superfamily lysophospholipase